MLQQHTACTYKSLSDSLTSLFRVKEFKRNFKAIPKHCAMAVKEFYADRRHGMDMRFRQRATSVHQREGTNSVLLNLGANDSSVPSGCEHIAIQVFLVISAHAVMCCTSCAHLFPVSFVTPVAMLYGQLSILFVSLPRNCAPCYMYIAL